MRRSACIDRDVDCGIVHKDEREGAQGSRGREHGTGAEEGSNGGGSTLRPIGASQGKERNLAEKEQDHALESEDKDKDDREDLVKKVEQKEPWEENDGTVRVALLRFPERIKLLEEYKAEHGHVHISHQHTFPNGQRNYFSNEWRVRYRKGNLEPGVQQRLEGLGFEWDGTTARRLREEAQSAR